MKKFKYKITRSSDHTYLHATYTTFLAELMDDISRRLFTGNTIKMSSNAELNTYRAISTQNIHYVYKH